MMDEKVTSNKQKGISNKQNNNKQREKVTSNEQKITSNEQKAHSSTKHNIHYRNFRIYQLFFDWLPESFIAYCIFGV